MTQSTKRADDKMLKPCPFCGGEAALYERYKSLWVVGCYACDVWMDPDERSKEACLAAWNTRTEPPPSDEVRKLREALEAIVCFDRVEPKGSHCDFEDSVPTNDGRFAQIARDALSERSEG